MPLGVPEPNPEGERALRIAERIWAATLEPARCPACGQKRPWTTSVEDVVERWADEFCADSDKSVALVKAAIVNAVLLELTSGE